MFYYVLLQILLRRESTKTLLLTGVSQMDLSKWLIYTFTFTFTLLIRKGGNHRADITSDILTTRIYFTDSKLRKPLFQPSNLGILDS